MPVELTDVQTRRLLVDLEPEVAKELDRHLAVAKDWYPHEYVPYSDGRTFDGILGGLAWSPEDSKIPDVARTSLIVNLLTEDNLPSYHFEIAHSFGRDGAWGDLGAPLDGRGGPARSRPARLPDSDPRGRPGRAWRTRGWSTWSTGFRNSHETMLHSLAYVSFQELATRISHRNTGAASKDPICEQMMTRIATDENLHMIFYRNMLGAAFEREPNATMQAVRDVVLDFQMPGHTIEGFTRKSVQIAMAGIYDLRQHRDQVLVPVLRQWKVWDIEGLNAEAEKARTELAEFLDGLDVAASRFEERRDARAARVAARDA